MKHNDSIRVPLTIYSSLFTQQAAPTAVEIFRLKYPTIPLFGKLDVTLRDTEWTI